MVKRKEMKNTVRIRKKTPARQNANGEVIRTARTNLESMTKEMTKVSTKQRMVRTTMEV